MRITVFFVGEVHDDGFNASALDGALRVQDAGIAEISVIDGVPYKEDVIRSRLADVMPGCDGLVFIGGQGNGATPDIAALHPDKRFAIVQGHRTGPNLASYDVLSRRVQRAARHSAPAGQQRMNTAPAQQPSLSQQDSYQHLPWNCRREAGFPFG